MKNNRIDVVDYASHIDAASSKTQAAFEEKVSTLRQSGSKDWPSVGAPVLSPPLGAGLRSGSATSVNYD